MNNKAVLFFENQFGSWDRYPHFLTKNLDNYDVFFAYNVGEKNEEPSLFRKTYRYTGDISTIVQDLKNYATVAVITMSFRPIDLIFTTHLSQKNSNIVFINVQHGIYSDKLERSSLFSFFLNTFYRLWAYIKTLFKARLFSPIKNMKILIEIFNVYVLNKKKLTKSKIVKHFKQADYALVFNLEWEQFFRENFLSASSSTKFFYVPPRDLELLINSKIDHNSVLFIAQSLVEDGRYLEKTYKEELNKILKAIPPEYNIIVKRHPRSNDSLYKNLCREVVLSNELIITDFVIGGYSSLLQILQHVGSNVFLWKYKNHHNPKIFETFSTIHGREDKLKEFFNLEKPKLIKHNSYNPSKKYAEKIETILN
jgi:hypothetical protein